MGTGREQPGTKRDLVIAVWESLDCETVGAKELERIQREVAKRFGEGAVESPAALARTLADEGALLRHPEVLECDAKWRQRKLSQPAVQIELELSTLSTAAASLGELENRRRELAQAQDENRLRELREAALKHKQDRLVIARSLVLSELERAEAKEIVGWLDVWLRTPELFAEWLELRRLSPEFRRRFGV